jgi:hypothetical protein
MTISTSVTSHSMTMIEAESVVPSTTQRNLAIASLVDAEPLPLSNATPVAQDAVVVILISTVPVVFQRFEGILTTSSIDQLISFPLSNAITVAAPVVVLLCTPPVVAPTSESYNHSSFDLHLRLGSDFDTQGVHVVLPAPCPVVCASIIHKCTIVIGPTSIYCQVFHQLLVDSHFVTDMRGMREVPMVVKAMALAVVVIAMVTNRLHASLFASSKDALAIDCGCHLDTFQRLTTPFDLFTICVASFGA